MTEITDNVFDTTEADKNSVKNLASFNSRKSSIWSDYDDADLEHLVPVRYIIKWSAQLLLALEKLYALGVIVKYVYMKL